MSGLVFKVSMAILLLLGLYYLYQYLYGTSGAVVQDLVLYSSTTTGLPANFTTATTFSPPQNQVPQIYPGGQYSVSTWIYVNDWSKNKGRNKPFLLLSGGGNQFYTMVMYLGQYTNKLGVRVSYTPSTANDATTTLGVAGANAQFPLLLAGTTPYSDSSADFKMCDIESVELQKWVNITAVLSGTTLDIYIDGKLSRSCVFPGTFTADGTSPTVSLGGPNGFGGYIGMTRAANYAYSPDVVYSRYQQGPFSTFSLASLNPMAYSMDIKANGNTVFSTAGTTSGSTQMSF